MPRSSPASIPIAYLVAYDILVVGASLAEGEWMLIAGASSGVGVACLQMGKVLGATVIGTSSSPEKLDPDGSSSTIPAASLLPLRRPPPALAWIRPCCWRWLARNHGSRRR